MAGAAPRRAAAPGPRGAQAEPGRRLLRAALAGLVLLAPPATAETPAPAASASGADLAKKLANPVASLISLPFQSNLDGGFGPDDGWRYTLNVQPVIPFGVSADWNLISRTIVPLIAQEDVGRGTGSQAGLGDVVQSLFLSPSAVGESGVVSGLGPVFLLPTATDDLLGAQKWGAGPTGVVLKQTGPWTVGALANHLWSFAGDEDRGEVNATFLQPFVTYTTPGATSYTLQTETTYDWAAEAASVPVSVAAGQVFTVGEQIFQISAAARYRVDAPDSGPEGSGA